MSHLSLPTKTKKPLVALCVVLLFAVVGAVGSHVYKNVYAAGVTGWEAGRIIDDTVFTNYKTMSVADIQAFLQKKVPTCDTWGTQPSEFGGGTRRQWAEARGYKAPFTCLKDYSQNGKKASRIIYEAARDFKINPQVLIVLLQKEQSLVTDTWPLSTQYRTATGYGCPDTAPCDSQYYGLTNQLRWSARMFRAIMDASPTWYTPYVLGNNYIQYNPDSSCGGSTVNIRNRATQALYNYTPYQPNRGALNAGWGTAPCGAYGNRNFYLYFRDWFGAMRTPDFKFETITGNTGAIIPTNSSSLSNYTSTVAANDRIYQFYYDATNKCLRFLHWNGSKWVDQILDGAGASNGYTTAHDVGQHVKAVNYNGNIQVFYYDATTGDLRHAWTNSSGWNFETLDGDTGAVGKTEANMGQDIAPVVHNGEIQLYYYDTTNGNLRHAWTNGGRWRFEVLDGASDSIGKADINAGVDVNATIYQDKLQLYYYDATNGNLRHAWWNNNMWNFEAMDGTADSIGKADIDAGREVVSFVYSGRLQLYYYDATNGNLRHAWWNNNMWNFEAMDGTADSVIGNDITTGTRIAVEQIKGALYVFYFDTTNQAWKVAFWNGVDWYGYNLDGGANSMSGSSAAVGGRLSVDVLNGSSLQVFYKNSTGGLNHAWLNR